MSNPLESIVRPFQLPKTVAPAFVPNANVSAVKNIIINPGRGGSVKQMSGSFSSVFTFYLDKRDTEKTS